MKYVIEIKDIDVRPSDWTNKSEWPGVGIYSVKDDTSLYVVDKYGVNYISYQDIFTTHPITDEELTPGITESLLLKAIAAASHAQTLK